VLVTPIQKATPLRSLTLLLVRATMFFNTLIVFAAVSSSALLNVQAHGTFSPPFAAVYRSPNSLCRDNHRSDWCQWCTGCRFRYDRFHRFTLAF
jgi:hypothetical protein